MNIEEFSMGYYKILCSYFSLILDVSMEMDASIINMGYCSTIWDKNQATKASKLESNQLQHWASSFEFFQINELHATIFLPTYSYTL